MFLGAYAAYVVNGKTFYRENGLFWDNFLPDGKIGKIWRFTFFSTIILYQVKMTQDSEKWS